MACSANQSTFDDFAAALGMAAVVGIAADRQGKRVQAINRDGARVVLCAGKVASSRSRGGLEVLAPIPLWAQGRVGFTARRTNTDGHQLTVVTGRFLASRVVDVAAEATAERSPDGGHPEVSGTQSD